MCQNENEIQNKKIILHVLVFFICMVKSFVEITLPIPNDLNLSLIRLG